MAGFAVLLPEPVLRASELWARRDAIRWQADVRESLISVGRIASGPIRQWTDDGTRFRLER